MAIKIKFKGYISTIEMKIFGVTIHIVITEDPNFFIDKSGLRMWLCEDPDEDVSKYSDAMCFQKKQKDYYILMSPNVDIDQSAHETVHCIGRIFRDRGIKASYHNDEIFAYYVGWTTQKVCDHLYQSSRLIKSEKEKLNENN